MVNKNLIKILGILNKPFFFGLNLHMLREDLKIFKHSNEKQTNNHDITVLYYFNSIFGYNNPDIKHK